MADQDRGTDEGPNLELPSLGLGRKKKPTKKTREATDEAPATPAAEQDATPSVQQSPDTADDTGHEVTGEEEPTSSPRPGRSKHRGRRPTRPARSLRRGRGAPTSSPEPPGTATAATATAPGGSGVEEAPDHAADAEVSADAEGPGAAEPVRHEPLITLPTVSGRVAAVITGLVVGATLVLLTYASLRLCEVVKGTSSCGGPGLLLMVAVLVGLVFLGRALLRAWDVPDPLSTSMLAVGLLAVIVLLVLVDVVFSWAMVIVIPLVAMATFALSYWVTTHVIQPYDE